MPSSVADFSVPVPCMTWICSPAPANPPWEEMLEDALPKRKPHLRLERPHGLAQQGVHSSPSVASEFSPLYGQNTPNSDRQEIAVLVGYYE